MELNKENLLKLMKEYVKERPWGWESQIAVWTDFLDFVDTRVPTTDAPDASGAVVDTRNNSDMCKCGHTQFWHSHITESHPYHAIAGKCSVKDCGCEKYRPRKRR